MVVLQGFYKLNQTSFVFEKIIILRINLAMKEQLFSGEIVPHLVFSVYVYLQSNIVKTWVNRTVLRNIIFTTSSYFDRIKINWWVVK